jgi:hypothetical protein
MLARLARDSLGCVASDARRRVVADRQAHPSPRTDGAGYAKDLSAESAAPPANEEKSIKKGVFLAFGIGVAR